MFEWDVITYPCPNVDCGLAKLPLNLWYELIITFQSYMRVTSDDLFAPYDIMSKRNPWQKKCIHPIWCRHNFSLEHVSSFDLFSAELYENMIE